MKVKTRLKSKKMSYKPHDRQLAHWQPEHSSFSK